MLDETRSHDHYDVNYRHKINILKDNKLHDIIREECIEVNSIHSMIAPKEVVEPLATISSFSEDGLVESFELPNKNFVMGIKWHPELLLEEKYVDKIFEEFIHRASY
jgi:putative glutamine amidotransferase